VLSIKESLSNLLEILRKLEIRLIRDI